MLAALSGLVLSTLLTGAATAPAEATTAPAGTATTTTLATTGPSVTDAGYDLPKFRSTGALIDPFDESLPWNPTNEFIFPSVFHAGEYLDQPLGEWYMYYGPHDAPGGINLMYADSLDGPWTQYAESPLISNQWEGIYDVSHVASPDAVWNPADEQMYLFFHGENTVTRYATSRDGVHFDYGESVITAEAVEAAQPRQTVSETSYARVFPHPDPSGGYAWGMFFMIKYADDHRRINVAVSNDLKNWEIGAAPIVEPGDAEGGNVSAADLFTWEGKNYIVYHGSIGSILVRSISDDLRTTGEPQPLFIPNPAPPENGRAASAQIIAEGDTLHMFYEYGDRSHTTIGHAVRDESAIFDPVNTHPEDPVWEQCSGAGSDEFGGTSLDTSRWSSSIRTQRSRDTVSGGSLRMPTYAGNSTSAPIVLQPLPTDGPWEVTTKVTLDPQLNYQQAGLIARRNNNNSVRVDIAKASTGQRLDFVYRKDGRDRIAALTDYEVLPSGFDGTIWLRMTSNGEWITASSSIDGVTFQNVGRAAPVGELHATDVGPFAYRGPSTTPQVKAVFDWVRFAPDEAELAGCRPQVTVKGGEQFTVGSDGTYSKVSFALHDDTKIDRLTLNGVEKDLVDDVWSDLNFVVPGRFGAVTGSNTLVVYDVAGNSTTIEFILE